jgi:transposase
MPAMGWLVRDRTALKNREKNLTIAILKRQCKQRLDQIERHIEALDAEIAGLIAAGKPPKVAITAVMRKLIVIANTLLKADRLWVKSLA